MQLCWIQFTLQKLFFGLFDMISKNKLPKDSRILVLHTGGLQGLQGIKL